MILQLWSIHRRNSTYLKNSKISFMYVHIFWLGMNSYICAMRHGVTEHRNQHTSRIPTEEIFQKYAEHCIRLFGLFDKVSTSDDSYVQEVLM